MKTQILISALLLWLTSCQNKTNFSIMSPDQKNKVEIELKNGHLYYSVFRESEQLILPSKLGLIFKDLDLSKFKSIKLLSDESHHSTWETVWGENKTITDNHNLVVIEANTNVCKTKIHFKAFNDGIAFRYVLPEQNLDSLMLLNEISQFNVKDDGDFWWIHANYDSYELLYNKTKLSEIDVAHTPLTIKFKSGKHVAIHEAALVDYASMTLKNNRNGFDCDLVPWPDGIKVKAKDSMTTPWRTIILADDAAGLIESDMVLNLNEPNVLNETNWIEPMRYMGIWWDMHLKTKTWELGEDHGATTEYAMELIDFASANGFRGLLVEGWNTGWETWSNWSFTKSYADFDIEKVQDYALKNGMTLIGHHETGAKVAFEYEPNMKEAFEFYEKLGIKAVKTGYVGKIDNGQYHHGQWMVNHYQRATEIAAKNKVAIIAHEPIKATGLRRTYPNFLSREGVRGQEYNAWSNPSNPPNHTTIIPFTRGLAGPTDFTPGAFQMTFEEYHEEGFPSRVSTTLAKQLALYVNIYSPVQMACDLPKHYKKHLDMFQFIKSVPVDWEITKVINAEIGEFLTIARKDRNSDNWYLGSISNEKERNFDIKLDFLDSNKKYQATIYKDGKNTDWKSNPYDYEISKLSVSKSDTLNIFIAPGGGCAIEFKLEY